MSVAYRVAIEPLAPTEVVAVAECIVLDADVFPHASAQFGMRFSSGRVWVARAPGDPHVLGFLAARRWRGILHIEGLAVDRAARRRGIGGALVREAIEFVRIEELGAMMLHVSVSNRAAVALYEREGFRVVGRVRAFYPARAFGGQRDAYEMVRRMNLHEC